MLAVGADGMVWIVFFSSIVSLFFLYPSLADGPR